MRDLRYANRVYEGLRVVTPFISHDVSEATSPMLAASGLGIGINTPTEGWGSVQMLQGMELSHRLEVLPKTPGGVHVELPILPDVNLPEVWSNPPTEVVQSAVATSSAVTLEQLSQSYADSTHLYPKTAVALMENTPSIQQGVSEAVVIGAGVATTTAALAVAEALLDVSEEMPEPEVAKTTEVVVKSEEEVVVASDDSDSDSVATRVDYIDYFKGLDNEATLEDRLDSLLLTYNSDLHYGLEHSIFNEGNNIFTDKEKEFFKLISDNTQKIRNEYNDWADGPAKLKTTISKKDLTSLGSDLYNNYTLIKKEALKPTFEHSKIFDEYLRNVWSHSRQIGQIVKTLLDNFKETKTSKLDIKTPASTTSTLVDSPRSSVTVQPVITQAAGPSNTNTVSNIVNNDGWNF